MAQWVRIGDAAKTLGVSPSKLSRLVSKGVIQTQTDVLDQRVRLVDLTALQQLFAASNLRQGKERSNPR